MSNDSWVGWAAAGGILMVTVGFFRLLSGVIGLFNDEWVIRGFDAYYFIDLTSLAWWLIAVGALLVFGGLAVLGGRTWGRWVGVVFIAVAIISELFWLPVYPIWSILVITLYVFALIGLVVARVPKAVD